MSSDDRLLGVIEAFTVVRDRCPHGAVRAVAESALAAVAAGGPAALREQALHVIAAIQGWRGDSARRVHASLTAFLEKSSQS